MGDKRCVPEQSYRWFYENQAPLPSSHVWLCRYEGADQWPLAAHQYGFTARTANMAAPTADDPINGFGVAYAIGPVVFWLFGHELPGRLLTEGRSGEAELLIWPALGPDIRWPPRKALRTADDLSRLARRMPDGVTPRGELLHLREG